MKVLASVKVKTKAKGLKATGAVEETIGVDAFWAGNNTADINSDKDEDADERFTGSFGSPKLMPLCFDTTKSTAMDIRCKRK